MKISSNELYELVREILLATGADEHNADWVADHLISANLCGVDTHGVWHVPGYVDSIEAGEIVPTGEPEVLRQTANSAHVTGNWTFGQVAARYAMEVAIDKAVEHDMAVIGLVQTHHIGRLGYYAEMATSAGLVGMIFAGGFGVEAPVAAPYGGRQAMLHTNPIAMGFPSGEEPPMVFDYATTMLSGVKLVDARDKGEEVPPGCIIDKHGYATTDPADFFHGGAHLPFGGHKGYALMMAAEFLGRVFSGSDVVADSERGGPIFRHSGATMITLRADLFQPLAEYMHRADELERHIRNVPPAPGFSEVLVPGDPEARERANRERDGIPIPDKLWTKLAVVAESLGVSAPR